jgi:phosphoribosylformimino-5-aminoimidazole carboxamide ribotide isomerase
MILYPAIDLKDGQCVRLVHGYMDQATVFSDSPGDQARAFEAAGSKWIHVVDLNGAFEGKPVNMAAVKSILASVNIPIQLGGGIRTMETIDQWIEAGVQKVILGTIALRNPALVKEACKKYPGQISVGIDARDGLVAVEGWAEKSELTAEELALKFENAGVSAIIFTNVNRDGAMEGVDLEGTKALAEAISTPVIASGGVSSLEDLLALKEVASSGISGAISGRAIYDGAIDLKSALEALDNA